MSTQQPRRLRFRGRAIPPEQLAECQEAASAEKNWAGLEDYCLSNLGCIPPEKPVDLIEWSRRNQPF